MAGGEGSRLRPLTCNCPKPMVPMANRPVMEYAVEQLKAYDIKDIGVTLQYLPQQVMDYFGDGQAWGVRLQYFVEDRPLGTAGSVKNAQEFLDETFIVVSGDALTDIDLQPAWEFHRQAQSLATLVLTPVDNPLEYGVVITDRQGRIRRFLEKPAWSEVFSDRVNTGIYILEPQVLSWVPQGQMYDFSKDLFPKLLEEGQRLFGYPGPGYWCDIGNVAQYREAHQALLGGRVKVRWTEGLKEMQPGIWVGEGAKVHPGARLESPVLIGAGSVVGEGALVGAYTVLGRDTVIEARASLKRALLWDRVRVGPGAEIRGAVLAHGVSIGAGAKVFEEVVAGERAYIGDQAQVAPQVKLWPQKRVEAHAQATESVVWGQACAASLFVNDSIKGTFNRDLTPELLTRVGAAFASTLAASDRVLISSGSVASAVAAKNALLAGLLAAGSAVVDLGVASLPLHRFGLRRYGLKGGIHVLMSEPGGQAVICLDDEAGLPLSRGAQRKVENLIAQEGMRRPPAEEIQPLLDARHGAEAYVEHVSRVLSRAARERIRERGWRVEVFCPEPEVYALAERLATRWEGLVEVVGANPEPSLAGGRGVGRAQQGASGALQEGWAQGGQGVGRAQDVPAGRVRTGGVQDGGVQAGGPDARLRAVIERGGSYLSQLVLGEKELSPQDIAHLQYLLLAEVNQGGAVVVPLDSPGAVEAMVEARGGQVIRTKTSQREVLAQCLAEEVRQSQPHLSQYDLLTDPLYFLAQLLEVLSWQPHPGVILSEIPTFHMVREKVYCPWDKKGQVTRVLAERQINQPGDEADQPGRQANQSAGEAKPAEGASLDMEVATMPTATVAGGVEAGDPGITGAGSSRAVGQGSQVELQDGIRVQHDGGWALMLPDPEEPSYWVVAEGDSPETAQNLAAHYRQQVQELVGTDQA